MFVQQGMLQDDMLTSPMTYQEASRGPASQEWIKSMNEEIRQIDSKETVLPWRSVGTRTHQRSLVLEGGPPIYFGEREEKDKGNR